MQDVGGKDISKQIRGIHALFDLDEQLRLMERFQATDDHVQVILLGMPPLEALNDAGTATELTRLRNDDMAELVASIRSVSRAGWRRCL